MTTMTTLIDTTNADMTNATELDALAWAIDQFGIGIASDEQINRVVAHARTTTASTVLINVLADTTAPANVRTRAFGKVAVQASRAA